jgi:23S rRNA pseudouridine2604 synthase
MQKIKNTTQQIEYPVRLNRYMHLTGVCSRRKADKLIEQHEVFINNKIAVLGQKVNKDDVVTLGPEAKKLQKSYKYYIYNKPIGVVSHNPQQGEKSVVQDANLSPDFAPVGRLDKASEGLMLLTNDGRIVDKMLNPKFDHTKEYFVKVDKPVKNFHIKLMQNGVDIEGYKTKPAGIIKINDIEIAITLTEGKKHQIRRMLAALGYQVISLKRVRIMNLELGGLKSSERRTLSDAEAQTLLKSIGMASCC